MDNTLFCYDNNGMAAIVVPTQEFLESYCEGKARELGIPVEEARELYLEEALEECKILSVPEGVSVSKIDREDVPESRTFRGAWRYESESLVVNFNAAKHIAHEKRRLDRDIKLEPLDREYTYQPEIAEPKRQAVRDANAQAQIDVDNATTIEELETIVSGFSQPL